MKQIREKLQERTGASMLIAMVFMLFCIFVGGSVLTAATANGSRVAHMADQQDFLNQRSAAFLVRDELKDSVDAEGYPVTLTLAIYHDVTDAKEIVVQNGGVVEEKPDGRHVKREVVIFHLPDGITLTPFQRTMAELAVWRYCKDNGIDTTSAPPAAPAAAGAAVKVTEIRLENFGTKPDGTTPITKLDDLMLQYPNPADDPREGTISTAVKHADDTQLVQFDARYVLGIGAELYDFSVDFGTYSQLQVVRDAVSSTTPMVMDYVGEAINADGTTFPAQIHTDSNTTIISWQQPVIEKGGAE